MTRTIGACVMICCAPWDAAPIAAPAPATAKPRRLGWSPPASLRTITRALRTLRASGYLSGPLSIFALQPPLPRPHPSVERCRRAPSGQHSRRPARGGCHFHHRPCAVACLSAGAGVALPQGARGGVLRLLRCQGGGRGPLGSIRLATASGDLLAGHLRILRSPARRLPPGTPLRVA